MIQKINIEEIAMKVGYPCINHQLGLTTNATFRLASYSKERLIETVTKNLENLEKILKFNVGHDLLFFRIGSQFIPFASHPVCKVDWKKHFSEKFKTIGKYIKKQSVRISMHPDQFILINALDKKILSRSIAELQYHCDLLDAMHLDSTAKVQIHVGGIYKNKSAAIERFIKRYHSLPKTIKKRLVIENDDRLFSVQDCLAIHKKTKIPVIFDAFHHECLNQGEHSREALENCLSTWQKKDGLPMIDYSSQEKAARKGKHSASLNIRRFKKFLMEMKNLNFDIMLEIKDKEKSALRAKAILDQTGY